jgi:hypothetical protein
MGPKGLKPNYYTLLSGCNLGIAGIACHGSVWVCKETFYDSVVIILSGYTTKGLFILISLYFFLGGGGIFHLRNVYTSLATCIGGNLMRL